MTIKISKLTVSEAKNCKMHPLLYRFFLRLKDTLGAELVHRRKRASFMAVEIIFWNEEFVTMMRGRLNTLPEAEKWGFWIICRPQSSPKHMFYKNHRVYQLFLSPVHPKKRRETNTIITSLYANNLSDVSAV